MEYPYILFSLCSALFVFKIIVTIRQYIAILKSVKPEQLPNFLSEEEYDSIRSYNLDKQILDIIEHFKSYILSQLIILNIKKLWRGEGIYGNLVTFLSISAIETITNIPFDLVSTFVIEKNYGFCKMGPLLFFTDTIKSFALVSLFSAFIIPSLVYLFNIFGNAFIIYGSLFLCCLMISFIFIYPFVIQPLFNKVTPLEDTILREKLRTLTEKENFNLHEIYTVDGSKRSTHSNAYLYGFINKRIVLYDTLIERSSHEEILSIVAHELGHWKNSHIFKMIALNVVFIVSIVYSFVLLFTDQEFRKAFHLTKEMLVPGFIIISYGLTPVYTLLSIAVNAISRRFEYQADQHACERGHAQKLKESLIKLVKDNKSVIFCDRLYSLVHYTHPTIMERLSVIDEFISKKK